MVDHLRGHEIVQICGHWRFKDTKECTAGRRRSCGHCGRPNTVEGHDGCLGALPSVLNACCGHGQPQDAYVQFNNGTRIDGHTAIAFFNL